MGPSAGEAILILAILCMVNVCVLLLVLRSCYRRIAPNQALVIVGGRRGLRVARSSAFVWPVVEQAELLDLSARTLRLLPEPLSGERGQLKLDVLIQYAIEPTEEAIRNAAERFLKRSPDEIELVARQVLEGHLRVALANRTLQDLQVDRELAADRVKQSAREDLARMGLTLHSLLIQDVQAA